MTEHWSDPERAERWDARHLESNPTRAPHLALLVELLSAVDPGWCLDLGCGSGLVAERVLERRADLRVFGVDASTPMLDMARERLARFGDRVQLARADLADVDQVAALDAPPATAAIAVQALHHLSRRELEALAAWVHARLRPGALLAVIDPVLIPSGRLHPVFRRARALAGWRWNPDTYEEYRCGLARGHDRPLPLEEYVAVLRSAEFDAACLDLRADRAFLVGLRGGVVDPTSPVRDPAATDE